MGPTTILRASAIWLACCLPALPSPAASQEAPRPATAASSDASDEAAVRSWLDAKIADGSESAPLDCFTALTREIAARTSLGICPGEGQLGVAANLVRGRIGQCGDCSALLKTCAELLGFRARYVNLYNVPSVGDGHTMVEIWIDGAWRLFDPTLGLVWEDDRHRLLSFGHLRQWPELADARRLRLTTLGTAGSTAALAYASSEAFRAAQPAGPVSRDIVTTFSFAAIPRAADDKGRLWHIGEADGTGQDLVCADPDHPIPVGLTTIGGGIVNHWQAHTFSPLQPGQLYQFSVRAFDCTAGFTARVMRASGAEVISGWSHTFPAVGVDQDWHIVFRATRPESSLTLGHGEPEARAYAALDCIELRALDAMPPVVPTDRRFPPPLPLPRQVPTAGVRYDDRGIVQVSRNGAFAYHPFQVSLQAMQGRDHATTEVAAREAASDSRGLVPRLEATTNLDDRADGALEWLLENSWPISADALVWHYQFESAYNDVEVRSPWSSAFGQAYVIRALLVHHRHRKDESLRDTVEKACRAYAVPIEQGGLVSRLPDGNWFYEEIPADPAPRILNGHLVATLTLLEAARELRDPEIQLLADRGLATIRSLLPRYDVGYWSRYDLNPRSTEWLIQVAPADANAGIGIRRVSLIAPDSGERRDVFAGTAAFVGSCRFAGVDWSASTSGDGSPCLRPRYGPDLHAAALTGGTRQNSYVFFEPPRTTAADWVDQPPLTLEIEYEDLAAGQVDIRSQSIAHGSSLQFVPIAGASIALTGDGGIHTRRIQVGPQHFAWYVGPEYQAYHIKLLKQLHELTQERIFDDYARRWSEFLAAHADPPVAEAAPRD